MQFITDFFHKSGEVHIPFQRVLMLAEHLCKFINQSIEILFIGKFRCLPSVGPISPTTRKLFTRKSGSCPNVDSMLFKQCNTKHFISTIFMSAQLRPYVVKTTKWKMRLLKFHLAHVDAGSTLALQKYH